MKISYSEYIKKVDVSVLVAESIFTDLLGCSDILKIKDVAKTTSGGTPNRSNPDYYNGEIPWLKSGELNDSIINNSKEFITELGLNNSSAKLHPTGTLLVAMYGATAGKAGILNFEASTNQAICAVYPNDKVERDYLFWFFRSHRFQYIEKSKGGAQPNISQSVINDTPIPVPNKNLQATIAELLFQIEKVGTVDLESIPEQFRDSVYKVLSFKNSGQNISTELTHQLDLVKQLRQAFLREAMQGKLVPQDPNDEPASVLLEKIKAEKERLVKQKKIKKRKPLPPITEEDLPAGKAGIPFEIPENWVWCRLGEISQINPRNYLEDDTEVGFCPMPLIFSEYGKNVEFKTRKWKEIKSGFTHFADNDVVVAKITPCFQNSKAALITGLPNRYGAGTTELYVIRAYLRDLAPFIYSFIKTTAFLIEGERIMRGVAGQQRVPRDYVESHIFPLPPLSEQQRIVAKLDELMAYCDALEASIKASQQQNEMLLQQVLREALEPETDTLS